MTKKRLLKMVMSLPVPSMDRDHIRRLDKAGALYMIEALDQENLTNSEKLERISHCLALAMADWIISRVAMAIAKAKQNGEEIVEVCTDESAGY